MGADVVAFPELFIAGYPPEDLVLKPAFQAACRSAIEALARESTRGPALLVGTPWVEDGKLYNAYALLAGGAIEAMRFKVDLPNYGVFDEKRLFAPGPMPGPILINGVRIGIPICEDIWGPEVVECLSETGGEILLVPNGSPYWRGKTEHRLNIAVARVVEIRPAADLSQHAGRPGRARVRRRVVRAQRRPQRRRAAPDLPRNRGADAMAARAWRMALRRRAGHEPGRERQDRLRRLRAGVARLRQKNGFKGVVLGLSGGIDSALCAAMAVDALGADRVRCVMLPYRFTSQDSLDDAAKIAKALGVHYDILPIESAVLGLETALSPVFEGRPRDVTEENLQARARGVILMAISNKFGLMVVTTGNKSEMSVGYATLYGDMNGGFNPVKDLYKTEVFRLSQLRNAWKPEAGARARGEVIPENVIVKPPTAELRENQKDQDSLPPYDDTRPDSGAAGGARGADRGNRRGRLRPRHRAQGRAPARSRRIQAAAGGARRQGDVEEFRPRPPLSDRQSLPRQRRAVAGTRPRVAQARRFEQDRSLRFLRYLVQRVDGMNIGPTARTVRFGIGLGRLVDRARGARRARRRRQASAAPRSAPPDRFGVGPVAGAGLPDRLALGIDARLRQLAGALIVHHDVALLDGRVVDVLQAPAAQVSPGRRQLQALIQRRSIAERGGQRRIGLLAVDRNRLVDVLARIAVRVQLRLGGRAGLAAGLLVLGKAGRIGGEGDGIIEAVAGAHADRAESSRLGAGIPGARRCPARTPTSARTAIRTGRARWRRRRRHLLLILLAAVVLRRAPPGWRGVDFHARARVAAQALHVGLDALQVVPHLLDLLVERPALRLLVR